MIAQTSTPPPAGSDADLAALRDLLQQTAYTAAGVCESLQLRNIFEFRTKLVGRAIEHEVKSALDVLVHLFLLCLPVDEEEAKRLLPPASLDLLRRVGLLQQHTCVAAAMLYPVSELYAASDTSMWFGEQGSADLVFSAITPHTGSYLSLLPRTPCEAFLELCGGTGIAALVAAKDGAKHAWACDIAERSTAFARFNARLNGIPDVTMLTGDLYQPVAGLTFDRIAVHPPYMPAFDSGFLFRDGGADGEQVVRRAIAGIPNFLRPGGRFYMAGLLNERDGLRAEERVRRMLGEAQGEFDVALAFVPSTTPTQFYLNEASEGRITADEALRRGQALSQLGIERLMYSWLVIQRHGRAREPFTARRQDAPYVGWREMEWLMETESLWADPANHERILQLRPVPGPGLELSSTQRFTERGWEQAACTLRTQRPFPVEANGPPWLAPLTAACDGTRQVRELPGFLVAQGLIESEPPMSEFLRFIRPFATAGLLLLRD